MSRIRTVSKTCQLRVIIAAGLVLSAPSCVHHVNPAPGPSRLDADQAAFCHSALLVTGALADVAIGHRPFGDFSQIGPALAELNKALRALGLRPPPVDRAFVAAADQASQHLHIAKSWRNPKDPGFGFALTDIGQLNQEIQVGSSTICP